ncbi:hypothetical protein ACIQ8D_36955 [Streptomyces sp. NPDC096094]|uniref:hypothetical protein n=1 Tax=Streptomyces sp. NPDC096094 TaxID=3366073 RepID=UPI0037FFE172
MRIRSRIAAATATTLVILGGAIATAPTATAVGADRCDKNTANHWRHVSDLAGAALRNGPGKDYAKKKTLDFGVNFYVYCQDTNRHGNVWYYGKDWVGKWGWVFSERTAKGGG